jgi:hypothetical protein
MRQHSQYPWKRTSSKFRSITHRIGMAYFWMKCNAETSEKHCSKSGEGGGHPCRDSAQLMKREVRAGMRALRELRGPVPCSVEGSPISGTDYCRVWNKNSLILRSTNVHFCIHTSPVWMPPLHARTLYTFKIHTNLILLYMFKHSCYPIL